MKSNLFLALLVVGGVILLANAASAVTPKPRPLPVLLPTVPAGNPVVSAN